MKIDLYIDFDGVILDTIDITYRRLEEAGISPKDTSRIVNFYKCLDWDGLFNMLGTGLNPWTSSP